MANSVLSTKYGNWVHSTCARIKSVTIELPTFVQDVREDGKNGEFNRKVL